jgi:uncharacterized protein
LLPIIGINQDKFMPLILGLGFVFGLILLANLFDRQQNSRLNRLFDLLLAFSNLPVLLMGLVFLAAPPSLLAMMALDGGPLLLNWRAAGWSLVGMGAWGIIASLPPARRLLARVLPLTVDSPVHALALALSGYLAGNTLLSLTQGGLEEMAATAVAASVLDIILMQSLFVGVAILGVGLYTRRDLRQTSARLGLLRPTGHQLLVGVGWILVLVVLQAVGGAIWTLIDSSQAELVESISGELLGDITTIADWFLLAAATGAGEELLFRGALQPVFGIGFTSFLFALAHVQYGFTPVTLVVFVIGLILGFIRQRYSTTIAIFVHAGYNFTLGMLSLLATQYADKL